MIQSTTASAIKPLELVQPKINPAPATPSETVRNFGSFLKDAIEGVASQEQNAQKMGDKFLTGQVDMDQVMVASEQALLSLQLTSQVRNKVIEAYQEIMRTQI
ncbi:flagellar hook-basal body complex protein FliE [Paenibacillus sp. YPG26]|uniref:flagellar hook-basal body complex protein FliE n=1 Tax=Paenibacillus sp. YPG26 TaxID=2878915 RepID=UPI00203C0A1C|nr:flagellar hook-basal body complex protein FliE [Paenibacillus sp. YPG26]USB32101.1 flagellar hook-basal body complex protein FliE [Paenibacillus sp. YPG26]